ncbi:MAG: hypothetical protein IT442_17320 [Phycisphaeraceae bacterium]|nr:hypothetical protein [Phycisphaeraceae bacterium]
MTRTPDHPAVPVIAWLLRLGLAGVFIYAGVVKAVDPLTFWKDVQGYHLLPEQVALAVAFYLPWLEILCGVALLTPWLLRRSLPILMCLTLVFTAALASAWLRGIDLTCGCFGQVGSASSGTSYLWLLGRDLAILGALVATATLCRQHRRNDSPA